MLIKINGVPWEDVPTPDISEYRHPIDFLLRATTDGTPYEVGWDQWWSDTIDIQNDWDYYLCHHVPFGDDLFKMSGWAVDSVISFFTG